VQEKREKKGAMKKKKKTEREGAGRGTTAKLSLGKHHWRKNPSLHQARYRGTGVREEKGKTGEGGGEIKIELFWY